MLFLVAEIGGLSEVEAGKEDILLVEPEFVALEQASSLITELVFLKVSSLHLISRELIN